MSSVAHPAKLTFKSSPRQGLGNFTQLPFISPALTEAWEHNRGVERVELGSLMAFGFKSCFWQFISSVVWGK